jgi:hypothetical protein
LVHDQMTQRVIFVRLCAGAAIVGSCHWARGLMGR